MITAFSWKSLEPTAAWRSESAFAGGVIWIGAAHLSRIGGNKYLMKA
jgi:hypothetical protein